MTEPAQNISPVTLPVPLERSGGNDDDRTHLSDIFSQMAERATGPVSIETIRDGLGDRSFSALLVLFAALNMLPLPPGATAIFGAPLLIVAAQMVWGSKRVWLPRFLAKKEIGETQFKALIARMVPRLKQMERLVRPRYWLFGRNDERLIGAIALLMGILITLPIPLGNWFPACATAILGLALVEKDGVLFWIGIAVGIFAICLIGAFIGSAGALLAHFWPF
ncbi:exopolysaccharide biosynthesis protein [Limoniibacter endophyticus]|uniref:ABC transporter permease n=1 Tax=Limoniibacter endophyticus TaxID=1565040 RepID=A0A8J3GHK9_9HYPH|nr:exopolysaccharide biosynthesis protein [Limoniibacter endophyticus]GHC75483.1 ABC transporter permease [Limoniibacter endophyticus]